MELFGSSRAMAFTVDGLALRVLVYSGKKIESWHEIPLNPNFLRDGLVSAPEDAGKIMADAIRDKGIPKGGIVSALSSAGSATQMLSLPQMKGKKLEDTVLRETRRLMPGSTDIDYIFWQPLINGSAKQKQSVYVLAIPKGNIVNMIELCRTAGLTLRAMELKPFALARAVNCKTGIILHCEVDSVEVVVVDKSFPALFRNIPIKEIATGGEEACQNVMRELPFTVDFYNRSHPDSDVNLETPIYLSGGLALDPAVAQKIEQGTGRKVVGVEPPVDCPQNFPLQQYLVNVGLMLRAKW
jgi:Tfp pilus assembly PilM family ATPase